MQKYALALTVALSFAFTATACDEKEDKKDEKADKADDKQADEKAGDEKAGDAKDEKKEEGGW